MGGGGRMENEPKPHERVKLCGAKTRKGTPCRLFGMTNGRCKLHGGKSTGPKTEEGKQRIAKAHFKHGLYTKENKINLVLLKQVCKTT